MLSDVLSEHIVVAHLQLVRNSIVPGLRVSSGALFNGQQLPTLDAQNISVRRLRSQRRLL